MADTRLQASATDAENSFPEEATAPDPTAELRAENADLKDRLLRALAEMENLRKRTEREVAEARAYGIASFARDVLGVADNMQRAIEAIDEDWRRSAEEAGKALLEGIELTERELLKVLEKHGVKRFEPLGEKFDPNLHHAMFEVSDDRVPAGTVVQVLQPGFLIGDRILRPALVGLAKAAPGPESDSPQNNNLPPQDPQTAR